MPEGTPKYTDGATVKTKSIVQAIKDIVDPNDLNPFILRAEDFIDNHCGPQPHHADDDDTHRVFPRVVDEDDSCNPIIPYKVRQAAIRMTEFLYLEGAPTAASDYEGKMKSETVSARSTSYTRGSGSSEEGSLIPPEVKMLLNGLVSKTASLSTPIY